MLLMKIVEPLWASEVADGQKMFECVAKKTKLQNQFKQMASGDLLIVVMKGRDRVSAVCEVASAATVKETNRDVLKSKLQKSSHKALDAYLDAAESFDYVEFKHVLNCRRILSESSTAAFLERVGLHFLKLLWSDCCGQLSSTHNGAPASTNTCSKRLCTFLYRLPVRVAKRRLRPRDTLTNNLPLPRASAM